MVEIGSWTFAREIDKSFPIKSNSIRLCNLSKLHTPQPNIIRDGRKKMHFCWPMQCLNMHFYFHGYSTTSNTQDIIIAVLNISKQPIFRRISKVLSFRFRLLFTHNRRFRWFNRATDRKL